jgi:hypothetical protein
MKFLVVTAVLFRPAVELLCAAILQFRQSSHFQKQRCSNLGKAKLAILLAVVQVPLAVVLTKWGEAIQLRFGLFSVASPNCRPVLLRNVRGVRARLLKRPSSGLAILGLGHKPIGW